MINRRKKTKQNKTTSHHNPKRSDLFNDYSFLISRAICYSTEEQSYLVKISIKIFCWIHAEIKILKLYNDFLWHLFGGYISRTRISDNIDDDRRKRIMEWVKVVKRNLLSKIISLLVKECRERGYRKNQASLCAVHILLLKNMLDFHRY